MGPICLVPKFLIVWPTKIACAMAFSCVGLGHVTGQYGLCRGFHGLLVRRRQSQRQSFPVLYPWWQILCSRSHPLISSIQSINLEELLDTLRHEGLHAVPVEDQDESCAYPLSFHPVPWHPHCSAHRLTDSWRDHALFHSTLGLPHVRVWLLITNSTISSTITGISHGPSSLYALCVSELRRMMTDGLPHSSRPALS